MQRALGAWAIAAAVGLWAGPGIAGQRAVVDARYQGTQCTVLRGHAEDLDAIADLLEDLGRNPEVEEPVLREIIRSERGYEYAVVLPEPAPAPRAALPEERLPFLKAVPLNGILLRLIYSPVT